MKTSLFLAGACALLLAVSAAPAPAPAPEPAPAPGPDPAPAAAAINDNTPEIIEIIAPAASAQETLSTLNLGAPGAELSERNKRTIGILRQLFPTLTQIIEQKVQQITSVVLQTFGPVVLRAFLGNRNGGGGGGMEGGGGGSIELDDDDDDEEATTTTTTTTAGPERRRRRWALVYRPEVPEQQQNLLSGAESQQAEVRVAFGEQNQQALEHRSDEDQQTAAQTNNAAIDEITLDDADNSEENRNKRFLSFGGSSGGQSNAGGGSGNFLFDIVRRPAEAMARAAGSAFRLFAGTDSLNLGVTASPLSHAGLFTIGGWVLWWLIWRWRGYRGGSDTEGDDGAAKGDNLTEGVPGPITRLFIIANRGIANLIQDLILRLAQTSERIVNFKARLITSII